MSSASIIITQSGVAGAAGISRDDIVLSQPVTLSNANNSGVRSWRWRMKDRPTDSTATLSSPTAAQVTFTPDEPGTYLIELIVDEGRSGQVDTRIAAVRETVNGNEVRWPAAGEDNEANWDDNTRGYVPDLELLIQSAGGGAPAAHAASHLPGGSDALTVAAPATIGTANAAGSAASFSRSDHVHNIGTHASRHLPGGADALTTATAVDLTDSTNAEGAAASFARSNHTHAHGTRGGGTLHADVIAAGAAGFMSGADKTKLDGIATGAQVNPSFGSPVSVGTTNTDGASTSVVRADHVHQLTIAVVDSVNVVYEVNFASLAANTFANGTEVIDGRSWTAFSVAAAGTFDLDGSTGIRWIPLLNTAGVFNETNQTAAGIYIDVASLVGASYHCSKRYAFEVYYSSRTLNASTRIGPFLWAPAGAPTGTSARARGGGVNNSGGTHVVFSQQQSTALNGGQDVATHNVFGMTVEPTGHVAASSGIWSAGWPTLSQGCFSTTAFTSPSNLHRGDARFVISHSHNAQNPVVDTVVLERLRVVQL